MDGVELGLVKKNAPIVIAKTMGALTGITMMIASLIMGVPILRDYKYGMESLLFVNPIKKRDYLMGRFLGSFVVLLLIYSAVIWGNALGELMPWRNPDDLLAYNFMVYVQPFFTVVIPILFFGAALFFITGALSRKMIVVYTQGLFTFVLFILTRNIENETLKAIVDPFSLSTLSTMTRSWTPLQLNSQLIPFDGVLLYSKLFWLGIGSIILFIGYKYFNYNVLKASSLKKEKLVLVEDETTTVYNQKLPNITIHEGFKVQCIQLIQNSLFYFKSILKEVSFWAIVISAMVIIFINSISLGTVFGVDSHPATYFIVEELLEMSGYFFIIIMVFYSGELIWKEREVKMNLICDALPSSNLINLSAKFISLLLTYTVLMLSLILSGVIFQTFKGYYQYELSVYFYGFFVDLLPSLLLYTFISFFIHVIVNQKYIGYLVVFVFLIGTVALSAFGYDHALYNFGGTNVGVYSQMNGYGHLLTPYLWVKAYWFVFCIIILVISSILFVRGSETNFKNRLKQAKHGITKPLIKIGLAGIILFIGLGSFIYYNTNVLNKYWTISEKLETRAGYEQTLKKYEYLPQAKITEVNLKVELYPESRDYTIEGYYILKNTQNKAIPNIHFQKLIDSQVAIESISFEGGAILEEQYNAYGYSNYALNHALQPGDSIKMSFKQTFTTTGFENAGSNTRIVGNGTFFNNRDLPSLGYNKKYELRDEDEREDLGFSPRKGMAKSDDIKELSNGHSGDDGNEIMFEIVIGTDSDQTAIAPGVLKNKWQEANRNYFHYKMDKPMINFYSIVSACYELKQDTWTATNDSLAEPVSLEIYYHKGHEYNLDRMMEAMKMSLDYFSTNFSPYQYQQMRIMEFPRYAEFAQSFPNTVPFSEALGFMLDVDDEKDVDMVSFITAHELAHQWWGLQVLAANVQGRLMVLESLAQYSALMVMKQKYGDEKMKEFLKNETESYFAGRAKEDRGEQSLALVEKQEYIYYRKGAVNMYALQDYIGEANVNQALKHFIKNWNSFDDSFNKDRYATSKDLLEYFKEVTPDSLQYVIKDLFETVTYFENKTIEAEYETLSENQYKLNLTLEAIKYRTDSLGVETSIGVDDWVDVGIYAEGNEGKNDLIYLQKHKLTDQLTELEIITKQKPTKAGIDPLNKLIDKKALDNVKTVVERSSVN